MLLALLLQIEANVGDTLKFDSRVIKIVPPYLGKKLGRNRVIFLEEGPGVVITSSARVPVIVRFKRGKESIHLSPGEEIPLPPHDEVLIMPPFLAEIHDGKLKAKFPGRGKIVIRNGDSIKVANLIVDGNFTRIPLRLPDIIVLKKGQKRSFGKIRLFFRGKGLRISGNTLIAEETGTYKVWALYREGNRFGYKLLIVKVEPRIGVISKPGRRIQLPYKNVEIVASRGDVALINRNGRYVLTCRRHCYGILRADGKYVPFLISPEASEHLAREISIEEGTEIKIPPPARVIRTYPAEIVEANGRILRGLKKGTGYALIKIGRKLTIYRIKVR